MPEDFTLAGGTSYGGANGHAHLNGPIDDIQLRSWGIQLVDGRMPGFAAIVGCAKSNQVAVKIVRELQRRNILTFLSASSSRQTRDARTSKECGASQARR